MRLCPQSTPVRRRYRPPNQGVFESAGRCLSRWNRRYFENVGGPIWNAVLPLLNRYARIPICGLIAHYNEAKPTGGSSAAETMLTVLRRSILIRGFINTEFAADHYDSFVKELSPLIRSDDIRYGEDISEGLEAAPGAFIDMLAGRNFGKALVRVS